MKARPVEPNEMSDRLCKVWETCSDPGHLVKEWNEAESVSMYNRDDQSHPESFQPTKLLSLPRKIRGGNGESRTTGVRTQ